MMTRFKTFLTVVGLVAVLVQVQYLPSVEAIEYTGDGVAIVGTTEPLDINATAGASREDLISYEFASYIAVHFADFNLPDGDSVVISSPDDNDSVSHTYTGQGRDQTGTFIASFISGNSVTVTYNSIGTAQAGQGYRITGYSRGYPNKREESICGDGDQSLPAKCYAPGTNRSEELPLSYKRSHAVARLLINGTYMCTGWLAGTEGHLFTNQHCFEQEDWVLTTDIEFGAESSSCSDECQIMMGCAGKIVATTSTFITSSEDIDYAVVKLPDCVDLSPYGYLQMREDGPVLNESIYVPQHPSGFAKRIVSTVDNGDNTTIRSVEEDGECGKDQVGHDADTTGGSSGSPLIASKDNLVVAIHHCGGCTNTAVDVRTVLMDLAAKNISIQDLVATAGGDDANRPPFQEWADISFTEYQYVKCRYKDSKNFCDSSVDTSYNRVNIINSDDDRHFIFVNIILNKHDCDESDTNSDEDNLFQRDALYRFGDDNRSFHSSSYPGQSYNSDLDPDTHKKAIHRYIDAYCYDKDSIVSKPDHAVNVPERNFGYDLKQLWFDIHTSSNACHDKTWVEGYDSQSDASENDNDYDEFGANAFFYDVTATDSPVATPASTSTSTASEVPTTLTSTTSTSTSMGDDVVRQS
ncbi:hypothetical protein PHYBOEH_002786 [Phytophthora boehmeriae]|uniref:Serine protease n=1 Tax=Phytophthora boehmeriae TaxID=109152 RepID=A0A8T1WTU9_9STRA|nr:hypothetical protein PHYBOEH_002786 [Phytophthora boehmeriae]